MRAEDLLETIQKHAWAMNPYRRGGLIERSIELRKQVRAKPELLDEARFDDNYYSTLPRLGLTLRDIAAMPLYEDPLAYRGVRSIVADIEYLLRELNLLEDRRLPLVGTAATPTTNAATTAVSLLGSLDEPDLIVVDNGLVPLMNSVTHAFVTAIPYSPLVNERGVEANLSSTAVRENLIRRPEVARQLAEASLRLALRTSLWSGFADSEMRSRAQILIRDVPDDPDGDIDLATRFYQAMLARHGIFFAIAHEFGHIALGHFGDSCPLSLQDDLGVSTGAAGEELLRDWDMEFEADAFAAHLTINAIVNRVGTLRSFDIPQNTAVFIATLSIELLFSAFRLQEFARSAISRQSTLQAVNDVNAGFHTALRGILNGRSHPPAALRLTQLRKLLRASPTVSSRYDTRAITRIVSTVSEPIFPMLEHHVSDAVSARST